MKKILYGLVALLAVTTLVKCGNNKSTGTQTNRPARGTGGAGATIAGAVGTQSNPTIPATPQQVATLGWGTVTPASSQATRNFLSTDFMNNEVGYTANDTPTGPCVVGPGLGGSPCAIMFTVTAQSNATQYSPLTLQGGTLSSLFNSQNVPLSNGFLTMIIWDSMSGTTSPSGTMYTPIPVVIPVMTQTNMPQGGTVQDPWGLAAYGAGTVNLVFGDQEGFVQFTGTISGNQLTGTVNFANGLNQNQGQGPLNGQLGSFTINVCDIIQCS